MMTPKEFRVAVKLRLNPSTYQNVDQKELKLYRVGFKTGYKLAKQMFKNNYRYKKLVIKEIVKYVTVNDVVVPDNVKEIITVVANQFGIDPKEMMLKNRQQSVVIARSLLINVLKDKYSMPYTKIGVILGNRDHTTVVHHVQMKFNKVHFWKPENVIWNRYDYVMENIK
jgi:chromosomal replication initiator protein